MKIFNYNRVTYAYDVTGAHDLTISNGNANDNNLCVGFVFFFNFTKHMRVCDKNCSVCRNEDENVCAMSAAERYRKYNITQLQYEDNEKECVLMR